LGRDTSGELPLYHTGPWEPGMTQLRNSRGEDRFKT
jgi:hypothetical protein